MKRLGWLGVLLGSLLLLAACSARQQLAGDSVRGDRPRGAEGVLVSGRYTTNQGTTKLTRDFRLHADGKVTHTILAEGTHRFADHWRKVYEQLPADNPGVVFTKEESLDRMRLIRKQTFGSREQLNESGVAMVREIDGLLFRSVSFRTETGPYDAEALVRRYGPHEQATAEDWVSFLRGAVTIDYVVTDEVSGKTYTWSKTAGEIGEGMPVEISAKQWRTAAYVGGGLIGLVLLFVGYIGSIGRRHWETQEQE